MSSKALLFIRRNSVGFILAAFLLVVFLLQRSYPLITTLLSVRTGGLEAYRFLGCLVIHGSWLHVCVNASAFIILLLGFGRKQAIQLVAQAIPVSLLAVWIYSETLMPAHAWLCGSSPLLFALFGLIAWQERKTSVFSLFGIRCLSLPPIPMLGVALLCDAILSSLFFKSIAWPVHTLAGLGGLLTGVSISVFQIVKQSKVCYCLKLKQKV